VRDRLLAAFRDVPGVTAVATIDQLPLTGGGNNGTMQIAGSPATGDGPTVLIRTVSPNYVDAMGIPLRNGRGFTDRDRDGATRVVLVNERLAAQVFGDAAIGQRVTFEFFPGRPLWEIVGVVADEQFEDLDRSRRRSSSLWHFCAPSRWPRASCRWCAPHGWIPRLPCGRSERPAPGARQPGSRVVRSRAYESHARTLTESRQARLPRFCIAAATASRWYCWHTACGLTARTFHQIL
jgi:hypothetical protein